MVGWAKPVDVMPSSSTIRTRGHMSDTTETTELRDSLLAAFAPQPITREILADPGGAWEQWSGATEFESRVMGKPWTAIDHSTIETYPEAIGLAGVRGFGALLPAYLLYLLHREADNEVPVHTAGVLTRGRRKLGQKLFDDSIGALTDVQRGVVKRVLEALSRREPMKNAMKEALRSYWRELDLSGQTT